MALCLVISFYSPADGYPLSLKSCCVS